MSDQQKIWFIYLTDHHEGPFTPAEVAEKIGQGAVTPQSLGWKDGMAEWVPIESIPELSAALSAPAGASLEAAPAADAAGGDEGFSLAQMLASQQSGGAPAEADAGAAMSMEVIGDAPAAAPAAANDQPVDPSDPVWTMKVGEQVSGLFSLQQLKGMAAQGDVPGHAMLWHSGWSDFQPLSSVPEVNSARQAKPAGMARGTQTQITSPGMSRPVGAGQAQRPRGLTPITASADVGSDDPTDPGISSPRKSGFMDRIKGLFARKPKAAKAAPGKAGTKRGAGGGVMASVKRLAPILGGIAVVAIGGAAYVMFFSSPIPSDLDVIPDDLEMMKEVAKAPLAEGAKLHLALARGTEDNPADDTAPKFYVATNLAEGAGITLAISGHVGTLVNKPSLEKTYTATVGPKHYAVFESLQDDGKPLPMGMYSMKLAADGAEPVVTERFLGGKKSGVYASRLAKYKEKLQGDYDKEMQVLREFIDTLKSLQAEVSRHIREYNTNWQNPSVRTKIVNEWRTFSVNGQTLAAQLDHKVRGYTGGSVAPFHPRAFQDISTTLSQVLQLIQLHSDRLSGKPPQSNPNDLDGLIQAGVISLDQWLAQAVVKNPFDVLTAGSQPENPAAPPGAPPVAPGAVPAAAPAPAP